MNKKHKKLNLKSEKVRALSGSDLNLVVGGIRTTLGCPTNDDFCCNGSGSCTTG